MSKSSQGRRGKENYMKGRQKHLREQQRTYAKLFLMSVRLNNGARFTLLSGAPANGAEFVEHTQRLRGRRADLKVWGE